MTHPATAHARSLWRSAGLRLSALFGFLMLLTLLFALSLVYLQVSSILHRNVERQLLQMQQHLAMLHAREGPDAVIAAIGQILRDGRNTDFELVLLTTPAGEFMAGNIDALVLGSFGGANSRSGPVAVGTQTIDAQMIRQRLPDGAWLVLGHDLRELRSIEATVSSASLGAGVFSLALAVLGGWVFRRELGRSVNALHRTITRIAGGQLHERVTPSPDSPDDEFAQLEQDFNLMLDRIGQLMEGVTQVSDAIAHNLRTPLTRLRLRLQAAHDSHTDPEPLRAAMASAMEDIDDLSRVLEKLLSIAQAESGTPRAPFMPLSWALIGKDVVELYEDLAEYEGVTLQWDCEHEAPLQGDRHLLAGALVNVVDNAIKYAGSGAVVRVLSRTSQFGQSRDQGQNQSLEQVHGSWSDIVVEDNGPGAPPDFIAHLGQRFVRLHPELPGHGLGLASVKAVMQLHGGEMLIEAADPGLRVILRLPMRAP